MAISNPRINLFRTRNLQNLPFPLFFNTKIPFLSAIIKSRSPSMSTSLSSTDIAEIHLHLNLLLPFQIQPDTADNLRWEFYYELQNDEIIRENPDIQMRILIHKGQVLNARHSWKQSS